MRVCVVYYPGKSILFGGCDAVLYEISLGNSGVNYCASG